MDGGETVHSVMKNLNSTYQLDNKFLLYFLYDQLCWACFHIQVGHLHVFLGKNIYSVTLPIF